MNEVEFSAAKADLDKAIVRREAAIAAATAAEDKVESLKRYQSALALVNEEVTALATQIQQTCQQTISDFVTRCLESIFPENRYRFSLIFEVKRKQTEARAVLVDGDGFQYDALRSCGGGVVDIVSFALRLATLMLLTPAPSRVLVLDEPFRFLSENHRARLVELLDALCKETGFQIIMVTHIKELTTKGHIIEL
jgi:DNA repair exonuclease SbcCD ATPase subunit